MENNSHIRIQQHQNHVTKSVNEFFKYLLFFTLRWVQSINSGEQQQQKVKVINIGNLVWFDTIEFQEAWIGRNEIQFLVGGKNRMKK